MVVRSAVAFSCAVLAAMFTVPTYLRRGVLSVLILTLGLPVPATAAASIDAIHTVRIHSARHPDLYRWYNQNTPTPTTFETIYDEHGQKLFVEETGHHSLGIYGGQISIRRYRIYRFEGGDIFFPRANLVIERPELARVLVRSAVFRLLLFRQAAELHVDGNGTGCTSPMDTDYDPTTGACGSGSDDVWDTIAGALAEESGGDTVILHTQGSPYSEGINNTIADGSDGAPTILRAYAGDSVVIDGWTGTTGAHAIIELENADYITLDGQETNCSGTLTSGKTDAETCTGLIFDGTNLPNGRSGPGGFRVGTNNGSGAGSTHLTFQFLVIRNVGSLGENNGKPPMASREGGTAIGGNAARFNWYNYVYVHDGGGWDDTFNSGHHGMYPQDSSLLVENGSFANIGLGVDDSDEYIGACINNYSAFNDQDNNVVRFNRFDACGASAVALYHGKGNYIVSNFSDDTPKVVGFGGGAVVYRMNDHDNFILSNTAINVPAEHYAAGYIAGSFGNGWTISENSFPGSDIYLPNSTGTVFDNNNCGEQIEASTTACEITESTLASLYTDPGAGDYTPLDTGPLDDAGDPHTAVAFDLAGITRDATNPDVGAYEENEGASPGAITIDVPLAGFTFAFGSLVTSRWSTTGLTGNVDWCISNKGSGGPWELIASPAFNGSPYTDVLKGPVGANYYSCVEQNGAEGDCNCSDGVEDTDGPFSIQANDSGTLQ